MSVVHIMFENDWIRIPQMLHHRGELFLACVKLEHGLLHARST